MALSNKPTKEELLIFLDSINEDFNPYLTAKVNLREFVDKITDKAVLIYQRDNNSRLVGLVVLYCNNEKERISYISLVGVHKDYRRKGIAKKLLIEAISYAQKMNFLVLGIHSNNPAAINLYSSLGFRFEEKGERVYMQKKLQYEGKTVLVTAIGSFSADCVIRELKKNRFYIIGCDIYPSEWHAVSKDCNKTYQVPLATDSDNYIKNILSICVENNVDFIVPLTDIEIDVFNRSRAQFENNGIILCMPNSNTLNIVRDKYILYKTFEHDNNVPSIRTFKTGVDIIPNIIPSVAKPCNGRSSEGLKFINDINELEQIKSFDNYIIQDYITGSIYTVDYTRSAETGHDFCIPREELLRTKNGAGITVKVTLDENLCQMVSYIGKKIDINGTINMEFIKHDDIFYLIDINPRFSAGVAFSQVIGYNMVMSHLNCFMHSDIFPTIAYSEQIITKRYKEELM